MTHTIDARNRLAEKHFGLVWAVARQLRERLPAWIDLDELISDGALGLLRAASNYRTNPTCPFRRFAARCIRAAMVDGLRQRSSMLKVRTRSFASGTAIHDPALLRIEHTDHVRTLLRHVSARRREVLRMHFIREMTMKQIGHVMGITEARVCQLVHKSLREIRRREAA